MGFFGNFLAHRSESVALIDVGSGSVGGAYFSHEKEGPTLQYSARVPVEIHGSEPLAFAMLRALSEVGSRLVAKGAPILRRNTGSGSVTGAVVSVASPWQSTNVHIERIEESKPFLFTRALMHEVIQKTVEVNPDRISSGESVIATVLNGYETSQPFGKRVRLADIVALSSSIEKTAAQSIEEVLRKTYHTREISFAAFAPLAYGVFRDVYPHEKDYLVIDAAGEATDIAFVKKGLLISVISVPLGVNHLLHSMGKVAPVASALAEEGGGVHIIRTADGGAPVTAARAKWVAAILEALTSFSEEHALPRTIFLLADESVRDYLRRALDDATLRSLWLSDEPLAILPVLPSQFVPYVKVGPEAAGDVFLLMLALHHMRSAQKSRA